MPTGRRRPSWWPPWNVSTSAAGRSGGLEEQRAEMAAIDESAIAGWLADAARGPSPFRCRGAGMTSVDASTMVARMQAISAELSSLGPALEQAAPSGEFASVLANANAVLTAAADPADLGRPGHVGRAVALTPSASLLGLTGDGTTATRFRHRP